MPRHPMQKQKLLYLQKILLEKTDERHPMTINDIIAELKAYGINAERKSLYDDLAILETFGLDICRIKSNSTYYYVGSREFELVELKLLVDAIQSSKFITHKKSLTLIKKLENLVSVHDGVQLQRQVYVTNRVKTFNEKIYYNVDTLHNAISTEKQITFNYLNWCLNFGGEKKITKKPRKNGKTYTVSPWALCWDDENYYLIGYDKEADMIKHYRVDKMESIMLTNDEVSGRDKYEKFDLAHYSNRVFSMFGGTLTEITLSVDNDLVGVIADRFGTDVFILKETEDTFTVKVTVMLSPQFYGWLFALGSKVRLIAPENAVNEFKQELHKIAEQY